MGRVTRIECVSVMEISEDEYRVYVRRPEFEDSEICGREDAERAVGAIRPNFVEVAGRYEGCRIFYRADVAEMAGVSGQEIAR